MVSIGALWLPILLSAVLVFVASSLFWMVVRHHDSDWRGLPEEAAILEAFRRAKVPRGQYRFPYAETRQMQSPEMQKKMNLKIKYREGFRPFAPSVLEEDVGEYFDLDRPSPYMLLVTPVREDRQRKLPADYHNKPLYDRLVNAKGEDAMSEVLNKVCVACYTEITAQSYNDLIGGKFLLCKSCGRILYLPE